MIRKRVVVGCGSLLLAACAPPVATTAGPEAGSPAVVDAMQHYVQPHDIPASLRHLVEWHTMAKPVVVLLSDAGRRACAIPLDEAFQVRIGQTYRCRWKGVR